MGDTAQFTAVSILGVVALGFIGWNVISFINGGSSNSNLPKKDEKFPVFKKKKSSSSVVKDGVSDDSMKGYKINSEGRKTSYFTRELSEADKALLASTNSGPKRIDINDTNDTSANNDNEHLPQLISSNTPIKGSQWNSAGTFEEKDISVFARQQLRSMLEDITVVNAGNTEFNVFSQHVSNVTGDVSQISSRGKMKYIYDLSVDLSFRITMDRDNNASPSRRDTLVKIKISDISANINDAVFHITEVTGSDTDRRKNGILMRCLGESIEDEKCTFLHEIAKTLKLYLKVLKKKYESK